MSTIPAAAPTQARRRSVTDFARNWSSQIGIAVAFLLLWAAFIALAPDTFTSPRIYQSFMQTVPYFGIMALTVTMVIIAGDIDLSFPSIMALGMVGFVFAWDATGSAELGVIAGLVVGGLAGLFNGAMVTLIGIPSLVVTIGTQFLFRGLALVLVAGRTMPLVEARDSAAFSVVVGRPFGIPMEFVWLVLIAVLCWLLLNRHRVGQSAYTIGDNPQAAALMGIPIRRTRILLFVLVGLSAAFAGMLMSFRVVNFYPSVGTGLLLPPLAAVFIGGTSVFGGRGTIFGTFLGAFMVGGIQAGIVAVGLTEFYVNLIYGGIILISVSIHAILQRRFQR